MKRKMMHLLLFFLCAVLLLPALSASAAEEESVIVVGDGVFYFTKADGTIHGYNKHEGQAYTSLVIPDKLDGVNVTAIADRAFSNQEYLETISLPNTLKHIGESSFKYCIALTSITIPDSVTSIGASAFADCRLLSSATIGNGLTAIPDCMFYNCEALMDITFGANVTTIGESAFDSCHGFTKLTLPNSLETIGTSAFNNCSWLTDVTFGKNLKTIGEGAFESCSALTGITIPDSVTSIEENAFAFCNAVKTVKIGKGLSSLAPSALYCGHDLTAITIDPGNKHFTADKNGVILNKAQTEVILCPMGYKGAYTIAESVTSIAAGAFSKCTELTAVTFGKNLKTIGENAFYNCSGLTKVVLPNSVTHIGNSAFAACDKLTEVKLGSGVKSIGDEAFAHCALTTFSVDKNNKHFSSDAAGVLYGKANCELILAPVAITGAYTVADGTKVIRNFAFANCTALSAVTIPGSVETIEESAFANCETLRAIKLGEGVKSIGSCAFYGCSALDNIKLPDSLINIDSSAVYQTAHYNNKTNWDEKILYIGKHLIESESSRTHIVIREGTLTIADYAFQYSDLTSVELPESLLSIGANAFYCSALQSVTIPKNVTFIKDAAFSECDSLKSISVDEANKYFVSDACGVLYNKQKTVLHQIPAALEGKYAIASTVKTIADDSISYDSKLTQLTIPKSVTKIGAIYLPIYDFDSIYYAGSQADWQKIDIHEYSINEFEGRLRFNYVPADQLPSANPFKDVQKDAYFATPVLWASANKITSGVSATKFAPNAACTRAQVVTFLWRVKGCPEPLTADNPFKDVKKSDYYYSAVLWAYENLIVFGTSETTFSPNAPCTRSQVATLLYRISSDDGSYETENPFKDVAIGDYYYDGVLWAYENGITDGIGSGKFAPNATCTRAQIVTFLFRTFA